MNKRLNYIQSDYFEEKKKGREDYLKDGKFKEEYLAKIKYPKKVIQGTGMKIHPSMGILDTKQTYTTTKMVDNVPIQNEPSGYDEFTMNYRYLNRNLTDIGNYKQEEAQYPLLIDRKHVFVKQKPK